MTRRSTHERLLKPSALHVAYSAFGKSSSTSASIPPACHVSLLRAIRTASVHGLTPHRCVPWATVLRALSRMLALALACTSAHIPVCCLMLE
jgi:hypothetical protein